MTPRAQTLHRTTDLREEILEAANVALVKALESMDLGRWADPNDSTYDATVRDGVVRVIGATMFLAFKLGAKSVAKQAGRERRASAHGSRKLAREVQIMRERIHSDITQAGQTLDEWVNTALARGMSHATIAAVLGEDFRTRGPRLFGPLLVELRGELAAAVAASIQIGMAEEHGRRHTN